MGVLPGAEPFAADGGPVGVVLSHGFTGSPQSLRPWAEHLAAAGFTVRLPRLPGHGTRWQDLNATRWPDWYGEIERAFDALRGRCDQVFAGGLSMGGTLVLRLAEQRGRRGRRAGAGQPVAGHRAQGPQVPGAGAAPGGPVDARDRLRHPQAGRPELGVRPDPAARAALADPAVEGRRRPTWPGSPRRSCSTAAGSTTWWRPCPAGCCGTARRPARWSSGSSRSRTTWPRWTTTRRRSSPAAWTGSGGTRRRTSGRAGPAGGRLRTVGCRARAAGGDAATTGWTRPRSCPLRRRRPAGRRAPARRARLGRGAGLPGAVRGHRAVHPRPCRCPSPPTDRLWVDRDAAPGGPRDRRRGDPARDPARAGPARRRAVPRAERPRRGAGLAGDRLGLGGAGGRARPPHPRPAAPATPTPPEPGRRTVRPAPALPTALTARPPTTCPATRTAPAGRRRADDPGHRRTGRGASGTPRAPATRPPAAWTVPGPPAIRTGATARDPDGPDGRTADGADGADGADAGGRRPGPPTGRAAGAAGTPPTRRWAAAVARGAAAGSADAVPTGADLDRAAEARARAEDDGRRRPVARRPADPRRGPLRAAAAPAGPAPVPAGAARRADHRRSASSCSAAPGVVGLDDRTGLTLRRLRDPRRRRAARPAPARDPRRRRPGRRRGGLSRPGPADYPPPRGNGAPAERRGGP